MKTVIASLLLMTSASAFAGGDHMHAPTVPKEFEALKALEGTWEGKTMMDGKEMPATVTYKVTSGGTAIIETLGEGTEHEMVSVYSARGKKITMTHYCAAGNQPEMAFKKGTGNTFAFEMVGKTGIDNPKEEHMHGITLTLADKTHLKQEWTNYKDNKKAGTAVFEFTKKM
jgi:hypothetical protein